MLNVKDVLPKAFQSTLPLRGATRRDRRSDAKLGISIHTPLAGSDLELSDLLLLELVVSLHTPLAGSDYSLRPHCNRECSFNPHSPCGERPLIRTVASYQAGFQSTLPLRGATAEMRHF